MADELLLIMLKNFVEDGCWHSDGEGIFEDCANLDCHECFIAKARAIIEKQERERIFNILRDHALEKAAGSLTWLDILRQALKGE